MHPGKGIERLEDNTEVIVRIRQMSNPNEIRDDTQSIQNKALTHFASMDVLHINGEQSAKESDALRVRHFNCVVKRIQTFRISRANIKTHTLGGSRGRLSAQLNIIHFSAHLNTKSLAKKICLNSNKRRLK